MQRFIEIGDAMTDREKLKELYLLLEDLNDFFHQPDNYATTSQVAEYAEKIYPDIKRMYYDIVWDMLPKDLQEELENR